MNLLSQLLKIKLGAAWLLINTSTLPLSSIAAPVSPNDQIQQARSSSGWINLPGDPPPSGTGVRNPCDGEVVPLVPITQQGDERYYAGYTAQSLPTFRFNVPYKPEAIKSSRFFLRYRGGRIDYETSLKITAPGIIQVSLPSNKIKELAKGQWYQAELQLTASCRDGEPSQSISSSFWVKRKDPSTPASSNLSSQQQITFYRKNQMWFEALEIAVKLERKKSGNPDWRELLNSAGLKEIVGQPLLDCCSPQQ